MLRGFNIVINIKFKRKWRFWKKSKSLWNIALDHGYDVLFFNAVYLNVFLMLIL